MGDRDERQTALQVRASSADLAELLGQRLGSEQPLVVVIQQPADTSGVPEALGALALQLQRMQAATTPTPTLMEYATIRMQQGTLEIEMPNRDAKARQPGSISLSEALNTLACDGWRAFSHTTTGHVQIVIMERPAARRVT